MILNRCMFNKTLQILFGLSCFSVSLFLNATEKVVVMTSYPQEMISQFESVFEAQFPQYRLEVLWKQSNDALNYLTTHPGTVDVYWTPSRKNFTQLKKLNLLQALNPKWITSPTSINGTELYDPSGFFAATEIAGLGMVISPSAFENLKLASPKDWQDLTQPELKNKVAFPLPSKIGFAEGLIDAMLRGKTWNEGWALLTQVTLNARFIENGSTFITDEVIAGRTMVGITMDFFAASAIAKGSSLQYIYPQVVAYSPAHVAILKNAPHLEAAKAFAQFTLSPAGQELLFTPEISKLPVDPASYSHRPADYFNPYAASRINNEKVRDVTKQNILNTYFEATLVKQQALLQEISVKLNSARHLKRNAVMINEIEQQLIHPLISEQQLFSVENYICFKENKPSEKEALVKQWSETAKSHYQSTENALQTLLMTP